MSQLHQMATEDLLLALGPEIEDVDEETFDLFSQDRRLDGLGMLDPKASEIDITVAGRDFTIKQSLGILNSSSDSGTTGAVLWKTSVAFANWIIKPENILMQHGFLDGNKTILELGCGSSGILPHILASRMQEYVATDQQHILKTLKANLVTHAAAQITKSKKADNIRILALDWETSDVSLTLTSNGLASGADIIVACDCIYNYALIEPFTQTCAEICRMRTAHHGEDGHLRPTVCVLAQHLRQPEVFDEWLDRFMRGFRVWRVPGDVLSTEVGEESEFVVHLAVLR
ncbi:hypothetical protein EJ03DRAFT_284209 [Teratosphaeria nubilosa]|uniref:Diaminohydroxyphosphoribosylamino-pyrimidine deaminase n=1 Tax=Teratosphaeria nubilosa TaxID=161662 RepID=A0A6G1LPP8_9PEZI|nr:hypothetical protein EJ03DRAFT_284209 [Teratosphaeria nubilosa]